MRPSPWSWRWCIDASNDDVTAVFSRRGPRGRARLLVSTTSVGLRTARRRFPDAVRMGHGTYRAGPRSTRFFGDRFVGVAARRLLDDPRRLELYLDRAALPFRP